MPDDDVARLTTTELLDEYDAMLDSADAAAVVSGWIHEPALERKRAVAAEVSRRLRHALLTDRDEAERTPPSATTTIEHAKLYLRAHMGVGEDCPVCGRYTRMYRQAISGRMSREMLALYRAAGTSFADVRDAVPPSGSGGPKFPLLRHWGLVEPGDELRSWRVTDLGVQWIMGGVSVQKYAFLFDNRCFGLDGDPLAFVDALDVPFDLDALMREQPYRGPSDPSPTLF